MKAYDDSRREMNEATIQELERIIDGIKRGVYLPLNYSLNVGTTSVSMDGLSLNTIAKAERYIKLEYLDLSHD